MICRFSVENFYSINEKVEVDFTSSSTKVRLEELYLKSSVEKKMASKVNFVGGANASGKTNLLRVLAYINYLIVHSMNPEIDDILPFIQFATSKENSLTSISVEFLTNGSLYVYSVETNRYMIINEELTRKKRVNSRVTSKKMFSRTRKGESYVIELADELSNIKRLKNLHQLTDDNMRASFVAIFANYDDRNGVLRHVLEYWKGVTTNIMMMGIRENDIPMRALAENYLREIYNNQEIYYRVARLLRKYDLGFKGVTKIKDDSSSDHRVVYYIEHSYNGKLINLPIGYESSGTQRLVILLCIIVGALLKKDGVAVVDELDAYLHPDIIEEIFDLFASPESNPNGAQLIFSSQNYMLLSRLDKQQIVLTEKDDDGQTLAWRLDDMEGVESRDNFYAKYLAGVYGGVPRIE